MSSAENCSVLICGGGPAGLAAALLLKSRGWRDIVLVERRPTPDAFERSKSFNYQLDGRGQRLLSRLGIEGATLKRFGLPNDHFTLVNFQPDGSVKEISPPILVPDRKTPYWMTRNKLLAMLQEEVARVNDDGAIRLLYGHRFTEFGRADNGDVEAHIDDQAGQSRRLRPQLILGCDGLWSRVRAAMAAQCAQPDAFDMHAFPSPSTGLTYKVLNLPPQFSVLHSDRGVDNHELAYAFHSTYKDPKRKMALFALPTAAQGDTRSVNIILRADHEFWQVKGVDAVTEYLVEGFPQLNIPELVDEGELQSFADLEPGQFPAPQYTQKVHLALNAAGDQHALLVGDSAHAFPPDLGLGVNSALEDLAEFELKLDGVNNHLGQACQQYEAQRVPESAALVKLVQTVHPYQYGQNPLRLKLWIVRFALQLLMHKVSFGWVEMPGFMLSQRHKMPFTEMLQRFKRGTRMFYGVWVVLFAAAAMTLAS